jgi:hypothetical protein
MVDRGRARATVSVVTARPEPTSVPIDGETVVLFPCTGAVAAATGAAPQLVPIGHALFAAEKGGPPAARLTLRTDRGEASALLISLVPIAA